MLTKLGVDISKLGIEIRRTLQTVESIFWSLAGREAVITSTYGDNHKASSLHYSNNAYDCRLPEKRAEEIFQAITNSLGKDYDCVKETDHFHIEYDPKG